LGPASACRRLVGTPEQVADQMEHLWRASGCHGFNITPTTNLKSIEHFVDEVVPLLQAKGIHRTDYEGETLRDNLAN
jgi:alkanesulfonate monooxygenase SsuD/methylene tetrahydromethanopterin reductase-like flavin-dependent oxidoreductase (luciferase family)